MARGVISMPHRVWGAWMHKIIVAALSFSACVGTSASQPAVANRVCEALPGWSEVAEASESRFLIFGETHGTQEAPRAVQEFVCQVASDPVLLAVELDSSSNDELESAWKGEGATPLPEVLRQIMAGRLDGIGSQAMFEMVVRLWNLKQSGAQISIVAFNGAKDSDQAAQFAHLPGQEPHEAAQAENIRTAAAKQPYRHVVILVGSLHAQKSVVKIGDRRFEPMAMKLAPSDRVVSLRMDHEGGTAWNCLLKTATPPSGRAILQSDLDCSAHSVSGSQSQEPAMVLKDFADGSFDGLFSVGPVSASPPPT